MQKGKILLEQDSIRRSTILDTPHDAILSQIWHTRCDQTQTKQNKTIKSIKIISPNTSTHHCTHYTWMENWRGAVAVKLSFLNTMQLQDT